jgi:hypothetical protein
MPPGPWLMLPALGITVWLPEPIRDPAPRPLRRVLSRSASPACRRAGCPAHPAAWPNTSGRPRPGRERRRAASSQAIPAGGHKTSSAHSRHRSTPSGIAAGRPAAPSAGTGKSAVSRASSAQVLAAYAARARSPCSSAVSLPSANASLSRPAAVSRSASEACRARIYDCGDDLRFLVAQCKLSGGDLVLVRESAEDLFSVDPLLSEVDRFRWLGVSLIRCELVEGTVRPGCVVMQQVFG